MRIKTKKPPKNADFLRPNSWQPLVDELRAALAPD